MSHHQAPPPAFFADTEIPDGGDHLRLHLNENPYGPPPGTVEAVRDEADRHLNRYPDADCRLLREALAAHFRVPADMVAVGNGTDELVLVASLTFLREPGTTVLTTATTFPGYVVSAAAVGRVPVTVPLDGADLPVGALAERIAAGADLAFVCNPLNPTGALLDRAAVFRLLDAADQGGGVVVFDEAYIDFAGPEHEFALEAVRAGRRALVTRTFSKAWGLASVRMGVAVGPADLIARLSATAGALPFNVNRQAQRAVLRALEHPDHLDRVRAANARARELLRKSLDALGLVHAPSASNFVMVDVPPPGDSARFAARLAAEHRIFVRALDALGMPGRLRISVGTEAEVERLAGALAAVLGDGGREVRP
ncbi:histidinol-phosphate aminotransferase family protein [Streptomyces mobaraensis NBRC 13819 = DSM 40847]|uniref:histidinol-phosphate transaminase n=1 Tax=Streptomyces mobaraensis (strain ATCC 29032 / DSM 40847 / JCM 4168 / NBRC 13819 / NCIMB 11159 / IPCR 16-22) TaxID=1223523 RepID=M3CCU0_STRM1|nr:histidinol-phosphate transaminase [Streptomyces mobaraensis]EMF01887.1 histidinol-phosphate aminotransferase [Streptomyces mobaraensis NBRC 13819 = DSM 40847]QTT74872.1 histidinol-phosphate aminotransferase family protein [Streptomyces mobaraensis NBRC 13819 = DSM 40847]